MKVLTVHQPWARLLTIGEKLIENRDWHTSYRGTLLIHASRNDSLIRPKYSTQRGYWIDARSLLPIDDMPHGKIVGAVDLLDTCELNAMKSHAHWWRLREHQHALVLLLLGHPRVVKSDALRGLKITLRAAAEWMLDTVECVRGLSCEHTGVSKALQAWIDRGVVALQGTAQNRVLWLSTDRLRDWHDAQPDFEEPPLFAPVAMATPDPSLLTAVDSLLTRVDPWGVVLTAVDSQRRREEEEEERALATDEKTPLPPPLLTPGQHESPAVNSTPQRAPRSTSQELIAGLPPLPDEAWDKDRPDASLWRVLAAWWHEHGLAEQLGADADDVANMLTGLMLRSRAARSPRDFFAYCVNGTVKPIVVDEGRAWRKRNAPKHGTALVSIESENQPDSEEHCSRAAEFKARWERTKRRSPQHA